MKILLTGASSYVGARLFLDLSKKFDVIGTYHGNQLSKELINLDIANPEEIKKIIHKYKPDIIIHAASNANARWCEANPDLAVAINQESTRHIVESANNIGAKVILMSSFAAIKPDNVYGITKYKSEEYARATKTGYVILRPSLIIGLSPNTTNDRPFNRILKNLDKKTKAIYDTSWKFQPTYIGQISEIIISLLNRNIINETIEIAVKEIKTRYDIAKDILVSFGIDVKSFDAQDSTTVIIDDLKKLSELTLPQYSYDEIIRRIVGELKEGKTYMKVPYKNRN